MTAWIFPTTWTSLSVLMTWPAWCALLAGVLSAAVYVLHKRRWVDGALALLAGLALMLLLAQPGVPAVQAPAVRLVTDGPAANDKEAADELARALLAVPQAGAIELHGHGLHGAQWRDLPARPLRWTPVSAAASAASAASLPLSLDFARTVPLGRPFTLTVTLGLPGVQGTPGMRLPAGSTLQLLAENGAVLAQSARAAQPGDRYTLSWLPPLAETLVLQARLLDGAGTVVAQGPVPLQVTPAVPLQVLGRFNAPSFDVRALNDLLAASDAIIDWQIVLGKGIARSETARAPLTAPNAIVIDAAYFEQQPPGARAALLAQAERGAPLIVLGGNAADGAPWQRALGLQLRPQSATTEKDDVRQFAVGAERLPMAPAAYNPAEHDDGPWSVLARDANGRPWLWQRPWKHGRIVWVGVAGWHRHAIAAPAALGLWWQRLLDAATAHSAQAVAWQSPDPMPLAGLRAQLCAQGLAAGASVQIDGAAPARWQARADRADAVCTAWWPQQAGWHRAHSGDHQHSVYVYGAADWPAWQAALRHAATQAYRARLPETAGSDALSRSAVRAALPTWPFGVLFALAMLGLWWRERR